MVKSEGYEAPQRCQRQAESVREDLFAVIAMQVDHPWFGAKGVESPMRSADCWCGVVERVDDPRLHVALGFGPVDCARTRGIGCDE